MSVLVVAEHIGGQVRDVTLELVSAARELGGPVTVAVIAADPSGLADQVNREGVDEIVTVAAGDAEFENDVYQAAVEALVQDRKPRVTLMGFTVNSMGYGPALAAKLGLGFATDVFSVRDDGGALVAQRAFYGGKVHAELDFPGKDTVLLLLSPATWAPAEGQGSATVTAIRRSLHPSPARRTPEFRGSSCGRRGHHDGRLPALDRARDRREGQHPAVRGAGGEAGRDPLRVTPDRRRRLDACRPAGGAVRQDREAEALPRVRHLGRGAAPRRHEDVGHDHRDQHRSRGVDLQRRPLRRHLRPLRRGGGAGEALLQAVRAVR